MDVLYKSVGVVSDVVELLELELLELELLEELDVFDVLDVFVVVVVLEVDPDVPPEVEAVAGVAARYITERTSISMRRNKALAKSARSTSSCPDVE
ncbi:MAG TPA: hypothetical protein VGH74_11755 [Planctomycetaceae bacterium]